MLRVFPASPRLLQEALSWRFRFPQHPWTFGRAFHTDAKAGLEKSRKYVHLIGAKRSRHAHLACGGIANGQLLPIAKVEFRDYSGEGNVLQFKPHALPRQHMIDVGGANGGDHRRMKGRSRVDSCVFTRVHRYEDGISRSGLQVFELYVAFGNQDID